MLLGGINVFYIYLLVVITVIGVKGYSEILDFLNKLNWFGKLIFILPFIPSIIIIGIMLIAFTISASLILSICAIFNILFNLLFVKYDNWKWIWSVNS